MPKSRYVNRKKLQKQRGIIELLEKRKNKKNTTCLNLEDDFIISNYGYYRFTKKEMNRRSNYIKRYGLNVVICVKDIFDNDPNDGLLTLEVIPLSGFVHLVKKKLLPKCIKYTGMYHISIAYRSEIAITRARLGDKIVDGALNAVNKFDGWTGNLNISKINYSFAAIGKPLVFNKNIKLLRQDSYYQYRELHISM